MNLKYVEPTGHDYPKQLDERIPATKEDGTSACCTFNRRGTLLAIGCREGHINIWDFETRSIATRLIGHKGIVTSVSWCRNGSKLLSSDWNGKLVLWDIVTSTILIEIEFDHAIEHSWLHGRSSKLAMIHLHECQPLIITFKQIKNQNTNTPSLITSTDDNDKPIKITNYSSDLYEIEIKSLELSSFLSIDESSPKSHSKKKKPLKKPRITCAVFDKCAQHIYCGTSHGRLLMVSYKTWRIMNGGRENKITNSQQQIKSIVFSRCGNFLVINCGDRIIRYIDVNANGRSFTVKKQYQDAVERKNWNACCFSSNGEYICAASATQQCIIYIWQRCYERSLEKVLKGSDSFVVDMVWHPMLPILISVTQCGEIQIWNQGWLETGQNWSTFDANFKVLTQNVFTQNNCQYVDEHQWIQEQLNKMNRNKNEMEQQNVNIDIFKEDGNVEDFFSADENEDDLLDVVNDSLNNELIHLPIKVQCDYTSQDITQYLCRIKEFTHQFIDNLKNVKRKEVVDKEIKSSIKISNKNEKVLQNLTKQYHHHHHAQKRRKKKQKLRKDNNNNINNNNNNKVILQRQHFMNPFKSFGNSYNTLKMNASNVHKPSAQKRTQSNTNSNTFNNLITNQPPQKKQKTSDSK